MPPAPSVLCTLYRPPRTVPTEAFSASPPPTVCSSKKNYISLLVNQTCFEPEDPKDTQHDAEYQNLTQHLVCSVYANTLLRRTDFRSCGLLPSGPLLDLAMLDLMLDLIMDDQV